MNHPNNYQRVDAAPHGEGYRQERSNSDGEANLVNTAGGRVKAWRLLIHAEAYEHLVNTVGCRYIMSEHSSDEWQSEGS